MKILKLSFLIISLFLLQFFGYSVGYCASTYTITDQELNQLNSNFSRLKTINNELLTTCQTQKKEVTDLKKELTELNKALTTSKVRLENQTALLNNANLLLKQYEAETKAQIRKAKFQRSIAYGLFASAMLIAIIK